MRSRSKVLLVVAKAGRHRTPTWPEAERALAHKEASQKAGLDVTSLISGWSPQRPSNSRVVSKCFAALDAPGLRRKSAKEVPIEESEKPGGDSGLRAIHRERRWRLGV